MTTPTICRGIIAIPARRASTRLPDKLLLSRTGKPLIHHVIDRCRTAVALSKGRLTEVVVACDDEQLKQVAHHAGVRAILTGKHHTCGTTRIAEAIGYLPETLKFDFVVNVQGDEPELSPEAILTVVDTLLQDLETPMATLSVAMPTGSEMMKQNPNAVKVVVDGQGRAMYFSRAPIPYDRNAEEGDEPLWRHHLGIYAYRTPFLLDFAEMPASPLERREGLEQLRALEAGYTIRCGSVPAAWAAKGVDTEEDYAAFVSRAG
jgi:3-deoxy-manno-octulosonate cytidylyltransferase (CMP-KDO synthetase)